MIELEFQPVHQVTDLNVVEGAVSKVRYPFLEGRVRVMPAGIAALVVVANLQGRGLPARHGSDEPPLIGEVIAAEEAAWLRGTHGIEPADCGVILTGDYWSWPPATAKAGRLRRRAAGLGRLRRSLPLDRRRARQSRPVRAGGGESAGV